MIFILNDLNTLIKEQKDRRRRIFLLVFCALGILIFYLIFGYAQESVTKQGFGPGFPDGPDRWTFMLALVWLTCTVNDLAQNILFSYIIQNF